jgi:hypothetical protein
VQTLHYLRTKVGIDIAGIQFAVHQLDDDLLIETETVVGRELRAAVVNKTAAPAVPESEDETRARVQSPFVRGQVGEFEAWISENGGPDIEVRLLGGSNHSVYFGTRRLFSYYYALRWIHFALLAPTDEERSVVRQLGVGNVLERPDWIAFNVLNAGDFERIRQLLAQRLSVAARGEVMLDDESRPSP